MVGEKGAEEAVNKLDDSEFSGTHIQVQVRHWRILYIYKWPSSTWSGVIEIEKKIKCIWLKKWGLIFLVD